MNGTVAPVRTAGAHPTSPRCAESAGLAPDRPRSTTPQGELDALEGHLLAAKAMSSHEDMQRRVPADTTRVLIKNGRKRSRGSTARSGVERSPCADVCTRDAYDSSTAIAAVCINPPDGR